MIVSGGLAFTNIFMVAAIIAGLYFAREILVPIALAVLLSFVLAPLVRRLQNWHFPRALAVLSAVVFAFLMILSLGTMVVSQVNQLAGDLPRYQTTLGEKVHKLRDFVEQSGLLKNTSTVLKDLTKELEPDNEHSSELNANSAPRKPIPVEVHQPDPVASETLVAVLSPLISPLTTSGIVVIFVIFFLFQREDLRNRFVRLAGTGDLERTTTALDDAGRRLTRLFVTQLLVNSIFGIVIGIGLSTIGIPSAPLWGLVAMVLRYVPYIGALLSAILPIILAAAVGPDWTMVLWSAALFAIAELLTGQVIEPLVYGRSSGLSPVSIVVAAAFWTWLWGPLGLILSTPMTVCLVVIARHVDRLKFLDILLGDQPALSPQQTTYQRMLAGDPVETIEHAKKFLKDNALIKYYDEILLGALRLAQADAEQGRLDDERLKKILQTVSDVVEDLHENNSRDTPAAMTESDGEVAQNIANPNHPARVRCIPGLGTLDEAAAIIVADSLKRLGVACAATSSTEEVNTASIICVCFLEDVSEARLSYLTRRLLRNSRDAKVLIAMLGKFHGAEPAEPSTLINNDGVGRSLRETLDAICTLFAAS